MIRASLRLALVAVLVGLGWIAAKAQAGEPNFEIVVDAPVGETTITCLRGCGLLWVQRGVPSSAQPQATFKYSCTPMGGNAATRCGSGRVGGWVGLQPN